MEANLKTNANSLFLCRENTIEQLFRVFSLTNWPLVYIHGENGTGKTSITRHVLHALRLKCAFLDCLEMHSNKLLFQSILYSFKISENESTAIDGDLLEFCRCANAHEFVLKLEDVLNECKDEHKSVIVFDNAECLIDLDVTLVSLFSNILFGSTNISLPVCCIFISSLPFQSFRQNASVSCSPITIHFPSYTKDQLFAILRRKVPSGFTQQFYDNYITLTLSVLFQVSRNVEELDYICESNFEKYIEPVRTSTAELTDSMKLWRNFESHLRASADQCAIKTLNTNHQTHELPITGKYLLIAAFLASYNSVKSDKRFFLKNQGKARSSRQRQAFKKELMVTGPKPFTFERWFHIYKSLLELNYEKDCDEIHIKEPTVLLLSQIKTLVSLKLILKINSISCSSLSSLNKYRISDSVTIDFVNYISKSVDFDLLSHMERLTVK
ncbi:hypothetical protein B4U79_17850 [Dinothrombium tinctorium]|uniref:AAA+ ATPase domain-containing protein n=1 Tax=Dinothrombium tinctorium TaxID=1965070 RepID=A0A3S3PQ27_9ACAR|nr:hypothetical protein B4U79_17852 [Dinothrombium tinctorium]RWS16988.1 hypothetical protein B4U79_17850 [Dinothrombium tinctorium]